MSDLQKKLSEHQAFKFEEIDRDALIGAEYNPRSIGDRQKKALKDSISRHGLIQPIIWNKATGNVVGGHQRLDALDSLHRSKNYKLSVVVVDMSEKDEIAANIALNNTATMGEFDYVAIKELSIKHDLDLAKDLLFDRDDIIINFQEDLAVFSPAGKQANDDPEYLQEIKDRKKLVRERVNALNDAGESHKATVSTSLKVVFDNAIQKIKLLKILDLKPDTEIIPIDRLMDLEELFNNVDDEETDLDEYQETKE